MIPLAIPMGVRDDVGVERHRFREGFAAGTAARG
jgi:hypothetical protein